MIKTFWWVIAVEPDGKMSYLKKECRTELEAIKEKISLEKKEPKFRYELLSFKVW